MTLPREEEGSVIVRPFREGDEEQVRTLFRACFGKELSSGAWTWKYRNSYLGSSSVVAEDHGRIVAHYGGLKMRFSWNGTTHDAYQGCDAMTHPEYQSRGIIVKTALGFYEANPGREFMFGFPSERHAVVAARWLGWHEHTFINEMRKKVGGAGPRARFLRVETGWEKVTADAIDRVCEEERARGKCSLVKESGYLFWRFRNHPDRKYEITAFRGLVGNDVKAFAITLEQGEELWVLEVISRGGVKLIKILNSLEQRAAARGMKTIRLWMNLREPQCDELRAGGYREEKGIPLTLRMFEGARIDPARFLDQYCYAMGDYDAA